MSARGIGSVLPQSAPELPEGGPGSLWAVWTSGQPNVAAFRTARGALAALLAHRGVGRIWLPAYGCEALAQGAAGCEIAWYAVDEDLAPDVAGLSSGLRAGDAVLGVDYFGAPPPQAFRGLARHRTDVLWIEDRAQALDTGAPAWGAVLLYSPRKLVGVAEGGLLAGAGPMPTAAPAEAPACADAQVARAADPDGQAPERWFQAFQRQEAALDARPTAMGTETRRLLSSLAHAPRAARRRANWDVLAGRLAEVALWPGRRADFAPLAFPVRLKNRDAVAAALAERRIWCARHWASLPSDPARFPAAHRLAGELLSLPCDDRYEAREMEAVAEAVLAAAR